MNTDIILKKVEQLIADRYDQLPCKITLNTKFRRHLNMDSLDIMELVLEVEKEFNCTITEEELSTLKRVNDLVNVINTKK